MPRVASCSLFLILCAALAAPAGAGWIKLDDFEGAGTVFNVTNGAVAVDQTDLANHVYLPNKNPSAALNSLSAVSNPIADGTTGTLFFQFNAYGFRNSTTESANIAIGMTDNDTASGGAWSSYNGYVILKERGSAAPYDLGLYGRNGGTEVFLRTLTAGAWYNVWLVLDNAANTYDIFAEGPGLTGREQVADNFSFRVVPSTGTAVDQVMVVWNTDHDDDFYVDNFYVDAAGDNPTNPVPEPATWALLLVGLAALGAAGRRRCGAAR